MIAIFTENERLGRMLRLELARCGLAEATAEEATLWLVDLDAPASMPESRPCVAVGFSAAPMTTADDRAEIVLPLPYPTERLQALLCRYGKGIGRAGAEHLPGAALLCGKRIPLSPSEEQLFLALYRQRGKTVTEAELLTALGERNTESNVLQVLLCRLRRKLSPDGISRIRAVRGKGYLMIDESR